METHDYYAKGAFKRGKGRALFGAVHEDPTPEIAALSVRESELGRAPRVFCIASGGCMAFSLALNGAESVSAVDINPAQIALCNQKVAAFKTLRDSEFEREIGILNRSGIVEKGLSLACKALELWVGRRSLNALFHARSIEKQREIFENRIDGWRWRFAFEFALNPLVLRLFYARGFVQSIPHDFAKSIRSDIERTICGFEISHNPYAWQSLRGRVPKFARATIYQPKNRQRMRDSLSKIQFETADAAQFLEGMAPNSIDFFAISNILDASSAEYVDRLFKAIEKVATPDAVVCIRSITGTPEHDFEGYSNDDELLRQLEVLDSSPICRLKGIWRVRH